MRASVIADRLLMELQMRLRCEVDVARALETGNWNSIPSGKVNGARKEFDCAPAHGLVLQAADFEGNNIKIDWKPLRF